MEEIAAVLTLSQKDGGIPQAPYDAGVQPQGQRRLVLFELKQRLIAVDPEPHRRSPAA